MDEEFERYHIYAKLTCPVCKKAVDLFASRKDKFAVTILDNDLEKLDQLKAEYSWTTVPIIVGITKDEKEVLLGGFSDVKQRLNEQ